MEHPSKISKMDTSTVPATSDLLSRISNFLPQLKAANEQLSSSEAPCSKLDAELVPDKDDDDDEDSDSDDDQKISPVLKNKNGDNEGDESSSSSDDVDTKKAPTIELKIALGKIDENPAINWLANQENGKDDDNDDDDDNDGGNESEGNGVLTGTRATSSNTHSLVRNMLGGDITNEAKKKSKRKPSAPLITEVD